MKKIKMMYIDYKRNEITLEGRKNIIDIICKMSNIHKDIIIKYIELYKTYLFVTFDDTNIISADIIKKRLNIISRTFKINKIINKNV